MKRKNKTIIIATSSLLVFLFMIFLLSENDQGDKSIDSQSDKTKVVIYKSPTCGCCVKYVSYLKRQGFEVETVTTDDTAAIKNEHQVSRNMESCHTALIENYFVEGHVPVEVINKLLEEKPDIDGISLPEMPSGSPGMPGKKLEPFEIYGLKDGRISEFMKL